MNPTRKSLSRFTVPLLPEPLYQQEVAADMALAVACPIAGQRVIQPFRRKRPVVGNEQRHSLFQPVHVVPAGVGQALPVLEEVLGVVRRARQARPLTCGWLLRGHSAAHRRLRSERGGSG